MDNNFNQQAPQQPTYQQPMYQQPMYQPAPKKPSNINVMELVALICAGFAIVMAILGATLTCTCSASKTFDGDSDGYSLSAVFILSIFAVLFAIGAVVCAIIGIKQQNTATKAGKMSYIAIAVAVFAFFYALIPTITVCGYNCSLNNAQEQWEDDYQDDDSCE